MCVFKLYVRARVCVCVCVNKSAKFLTRQLMSLQQKISSWVYECVCVYVYVRVLVCVRICACTCNILANVSVILHALLCSLT